MKQKKEKEESVFIYINDLEEEIQMEQNYIQNGYFRKMECYGLEISTNPNMQHCFLHILKNKNGQSLIFNGNEYLGLSLISPGEFDGNDEYLFEFSQTVALKFMNDLLKYYLNLEPDPWNELDWAIPYSCFDCCDEEFNYKDQFYIFSHEFRGMEINFTASNTIEDALVITEIFNTETITKEQLLYFKELDQAFQLLYMD